MPINPAIAEATARIRARSAATRAAYLDRIDRSAGEGPARAHLSCGNQAHAYAAALEQKGKLAKAKSPNLGVITAFNDMLSAHQPYEAYPAIIREAAQAAGATAQVAGGVPAMCDGVTQGQPGMELSLFSRDVIAMAAAVGLSHNTFDAAAFLGVCDKIVPGLVIAAASFGHLPAIFLPAGPMPSGIPNDEKAKVRNAYAAGEADRATLMRAEMASYHAPGTCTFYGTANTNQMLMEVMGLMLPGAAFVNPGTPLRDALTRAGVAQVLSRTSLGDDFMPAGRILSETAFVNGIVGLMATGGSTNLVLHLVAMARAAGVILEPADFDAISSATPLVARVYPNGLADVNHFHAAGGMGYLIGELIASGHLDADVPTVMGHGLGAYAREPWLDNGVLSWRDRPDASANDKVLRTPSDPFQPTGGLSRLTGNLGEAVIKVSAVASRHRIIQAPAAVFDTQEAVRAAFKAGVLDRDVIVVVAFQGPRANGMPELHGLTPILSVLQDRGHKVALVTDGRMSGASGKVPAAIHLSPEAAAGGPIAAIRDGDVLRLDATAGRLDSLASDFDARTARTADLTANEAGLGRELFSGFRELAGAAGDGASVLFRGGT